MTIKKQDLDAGASSHEVDFNTEPGGQPGSTHTIQIAMRDSTGAIAAPAAGTLTFKVRAPGGADFEDVTDNVIDVTSRANWMQKINQHIEALQVVPDSVTAGYTFDLAISSSFGGA